MGGAKARSKSGGSAAGLMGDHRGRGRRLALRLLAVAATSASLLATTERAAHAIIVYAPGQFDPAFNGTGVLENAGATQAVATAVVPPGDPNANDIVVAVTTGSAQSPTSSAIDEYSITGQLVHVMVVSGFIAQAVAVVPPGEAGAGNIVAAGYTNGTPNQAEVVAFNPAGGLVFASTFNPPPGGSTAKSQLFGVAVDSAGYVVATGYAMVGGSPTLLVTDLQPNGTGSPYFPSGGYVVNNVTAGAVIGRAVTVSGGGSGAQIYVTGQADGYIFAADFTGAGAVNGSFGGGMVTAGVQGVGNGIALITNVSVPNYGNVVVAGQYTNGSAKASALVQWAPNGARDSAFNGSGPGLSTSDAWNAVTYNPYGNFITAAGQAGTPSEMVVSQFNATAGTLNNHFGSNGTTTRVLGDGSAFLNGVGFEPDGSTVAGGAESPSGGNNTVATVIRLDGPFITVIPPPVHQVTQTGTTTIYFTVQVDELLNVAGSVYLCASGPGATINNTPSACAFVPIPAGATSIQLPVTLDITNPVGTAQQVVVSTGFANGLSGHPLNGTATGTVQHLPPPAPFKGYWMVASDGGLFTFGTHYFGSRGGHPGAPPIVGMAVRPDGLGYWLADAAGNVFPFGSAGHFGSASAKPLVKPIVAIATTPDGKGYWLVASDGGIFTFGDARYFGSTGRLALVKPIVGMTPTPDGRGYWLVASDGGIFTFGDARFFGSTGRLALVKPIVGMAAYPGAGGYWLVASDGGIFTFGAAGFHGSTGRIALKKPIVGMAVTSDGKGYWLVASDGGIFAFGDAHFYGSTGALTLVSPIVGIAE